MTALFDTMYAQDYEQVVFCADRGAGLKAIIAIHDTTLGPALGGMRMRAYATESEAVTDALRLAQAMSYKAALAGLDYGGGKAVVIGDHTTTQREMVFRALGRAIESLAGHYIPTEDMGTSTADIERVRKESRFGVGREEVFGGGGDPSPMTAWGIFCGQRACLEELDGTADFQGKTVALPGLGKVGYPLARYVHEAGARLIVADVDDSRTRKAAEEFQAQGGQHPRDLHPGVRHPGSVRGGRAVSRPDHFPPPLPDYWRRGQQPAGERRGRRYAARPGHFIRTRFCH